MVFAMHVTRTGNLAAGNAAIGANQAVSLRYFHHDQLGSIAAVSDGITGAVIERLAYDPWGKRRNLNGISDVTDSLVGLTTDRGFTMHEHLDEMGLVHLNGRIYDPFASSIDASTGSHFIGQSTGVSRKNIIVTVVSRGKQPLECKKAVSKG